MPSCREVTRLVASGDLENAGWGTRAKVRLHLFMCRYCKRYAAQLSSLGERMRRVFREEKVEQQTLDRLHDSILKELPDDHPGTGEDRA